MLQKKKLRKKDAVEDLSFLEQEAAAGNAVADHGSRTARGALADAEAAKRDEAAGIKEERSAPTLLIVLQHLLICWILPSYNVCICAIFACPETENIPLQNSVAD